MVRVARKSDSSDIAHTNDTKLKRAICYCLCHVLHITIDCNFEITKCMVQNFTIGLVDRQVISQMPSLVIAQVRQLCDSSSSN
jgi:hypothetical protein